MERDLQNELEQFILSHKFPGRVLFARVWGSYSHHTNMPESDVDYQLVYVAPTKEMLSLKKPPDTMDGKKPDFQAHELGKFCSLLLKGNPSIVEMLFTNEYRMCGRGWDTLLTERKRFLSKATVKQYLGYAQGQLRRLEEGVSLHTKTGEYNTKWAYHLIRLLLDAQRIVNGNLPGVVKVGDELDLLMKIRRGETPKDQIVCFAGQMVQEINTKRLACTLPEEGDATFLNDWQLRIRMDDLVDEVLR